MLAAGIGNIRHQRHHGDTAVGERIDRFAHPRVIERHHGNTVIDRADLVERIGERFSREYVGMAQIDGDFFLGHAPRFLAHRVRQGDHEGIGALRQHETEAVFPRPCQPCRQPVRLVVQLADGLFHPLNGQGTHGGAAVQHPIDGCHADPSLDCHILDRRPHHRPIKANSRILSIPDRRLSNAS